MTWYLYMYIKKYASNILKIVFFIIIFIWKKKEKKSKKKNILELSDIWY
jgi:hypothetical protein